MTRQFWGLPILLILLITACKQANNRQETAEAKSVLELNVGVMSSMDFVPLAVAKEKGIFDRHHINVAIQKFYSANERDAAFQSGIIDGTVIDYTGAVLQKAGGVDLKITSACNATFCIMVGPDSNISQLSDLKGKKVAVSRNTVIDFCIEAALNSAQTSPESIEKQEINKIPIRFEMMMKGESDATALPDPFITMAQSKGARSIVCMQDLDYVLTGFMFKTEAVNQKSEALKAFYLAYNEAVEYIHTHPLDDIRSILVNEIGFPEALVDSVKLPDYTPARMPREKDLNATVEWLKQKDLIPSDFSAEGLADNRFIQP